MNININIVIIINQEIMSQNKLMNIDLKDKKLPSLSGMLTEPHLYLHPSSEKCVFNEYGQCIKGFRYFCAYCNYGIGGMFSSCHNTKCDIPKCYLYIKDYSYDKNNNKKH